MIGDVMQCDVRQGKINNVGVAQFKTENVQIWKGPVLSGVALLCTVR